MAYQLTTGDLILRTTDEAFIPPDSANRDYREYLAWVEAGNTPEPAPDLTLPPVLTTEQKLEAAGLTVAEMRELLGLDTAVGTPQSYAETQQPGPTHSS